MHLLYTPFASHPAHRLFYVNPRYGAGGAEHDQSEAACRANMSPGQRFAAACGAARFMFAGGEMMMMMMPAERVRHRLSLLPFSTRASALAGSYSASPRRVPLPPKKTDASSSSPAACMQQQQPHSWPQRGTFDESTHHLPRRADGKKVTYAHVVARCTRFPLLYAPRCVRYIYGAKNAEALLCRRARRVRSPSFSLLIPSPSSCYAVCRAGKEAGREKKY